MHKPIYKEFLADLKTPIEILRILKSKSKSVFLLESAMQKSSGRYTFLGFEPKWTLRLTDGELYINDKKSESDLCSVVRNILNEHKSEKIPELPPFTGGFVGYFGFDFYAHVEPTLKLHKENPHKFDDCELLFFDCVVAFDHFFQKIYLIKQTAENADTTTAERELDALAKLIFETATPPLENLEVGEFSLQFDKNEFETLVEKAKEHIYKGDIFQIVLSNLQKAPFRGDILQAYRRLRALNPSPYMYFYQTPNLSVAGASPETLVSLKDGVVKTYPLAGTRPRGKDAREDAALESELLADEKELSEHNMLVDLGRNDLGKICKFGTVEVEEFRQILRYSHVMHIGSVVRGEVASEFDALDAVRAVLPAGTLSGAPKFKACELIAKFEKVKRGVYGGAIGYIDLTGNADFAITIRTIFAKNGELFVRSGAGVVADSVGEKEFFEVINKARACVKAAKN